MTSREIEAIIEMADSHQYAGNPSEDSYQSSCSCGWKSPEETYEESREHWRLHRVTLGQATVDSLHKHDFDEATVKMCQYQRERDSAVDTALGLEFRMSEQSRDKHRILNEYQTTVEALKRERDAAREALWQVCDFIVNTLRYTSDNEFRKNADRVLGLINDVLVPNL